MSMTVSKLIEELKRYDGNVNVVVTSDGMNYENADEVDFDGEDVIILGEFKRSYE